MLAFNVKPAGVLFSTTARSACAENEQVRGGTGLQGLKLTAGKNTKTRGALYVVKIHRAGVHDEACCNQCSSGFVG